MRSALLIAFASASLLGCAAFPELDSRTDRAALDAPYPALLPLDGLLAQVSSPGRAQPITAALEARATALRRRAAALQRPVIDAPTRARLEAALERHTR